MAQVTKVFTALAAGILALALAGCADPPPSANTTTDSPSTTAVASYLACLITDDSQITEGSPNQQAIDGLARAQLQLGVETAHTAAAQSEHANALQGLVDRGCDAVVGLGASFTDAISAAARANPEVHFALMDATPSSVPTNLRPVFFETHQAAFLAGYLAASQSTTGKVGVFGGLPVPAATIYMDGFVQGVAHYNTQQNRQVEALGWNMETQDGTFVRSTTDPWNDPDAGRAAAASLAEQGADVILAVADKSGLGALGLAQESGVRVIWSDTDGCVTQQASCAQLLGSVVKDRATAVFEVIATEYAGRGAAGVFSANLRNGGTQLLPGGAGFTPELAAELDALTKQIIDGTIKVASPAAIG